MSHNVLVYVHVVYMFVVSAAVVSPDHDEDVFFDALSERGIIIIRTVQ